MGDHVVMREMIPVGVPERSQHALGSDPSCAS